MYNFLSVPLVKPGYELQQALPDLPFALTHGKPVGYVLAEVKIPENCADFRLIDKKAVDQMRTMKEKTKFFRGLINWMGFKQFAIYYDAAPRHLETKARPSYILRNIHEKQDSL
jgi:hypothetical protein